MSEKSVQTAVLVVRVVELLVLVLEHMPLFWHGLDEHGPLKVVVLLDVLVAVLVLVVVEVVVAVLVDVLEDVLEDVVVEVEVLVRVVVVVGAVL